LVEEVEVGLLGGGWEDEGVETTAVAAVVDSFFFPTSEANVDFLFFFKLLAALGLTVPAPPPPPEAAEAAAAAAAASFALVTAPPFGGRLTLPVVFLLNTPVGRFPTAPAS